MCGWSKPRGAGSGDDLLVRPANYDGGVDINEHSRYHATCNYIDLVNPCHDDNCGRDHHYVIDVDEYNDLNNAAANNHNHADDDDVNHHRTYI